MVSYNLIFKVNEYSIYLDGKAGLFTECTGTGEREGPHLDAIVSGSEVQYSCTIAIDVIFTSDTFPFHLCL